ncbi:hypothetical protein AQJ67_04870 [Streptomyces caeruleatus]|uniref:Uncharacterized protein n=1 Tax=Streptomyces caeruleatus TaxID=661399 RepID=A0A117RS20_9ACTN|nr:hypothetical protein AQJ67_04870 [Streptomyces caeruleatus]
MKYGVTRDYVLAVEMVTGTGALVRLGRRTAKGVTGYCFPLQGLRLKISYNTKTSDSAGPAKARG